MMTKRSFAVLAVVMFGLAVRAPAGTRQDGLTLVIDFDAHPVHISTALMGPRPDEHAMPPQLTALQLESILAGGTEGARVLVGRLTATGAWAGYQLAATPVSFLDRPEPETGVLRGDAGTGRDIQVVHVPAMDIVATLDLLAVRPADVTGPATPAWMLTGLFSIAGAAKIAPFISADVGLAGLELAGQPIPVETTSFAEVFSSVSFRPKPIRISGRRPPESAFDIVVLGDGFAWNELADLESRTRDFAARLLGSGYDPPAGRPADGPSRRGIAPFSDPGVAELVSIHLIPLPSRQSGITYCPCSAIERDTVLGVRGNFTDRGFSFDYDTDDFGRIEAALELIGSSTGDIEAVLVIANCQDYGGRGYRERRTAFVSMVPSGSELANLAAHELAHAVADLGDEYEGCNTEADVGRSFCNIANAEQRKRNDVWWANIADEGDYEVVDEKRALTVVEYCDGPEEEEGRLGLFAGAMFIDLPGPPCHCDPDTDRRVCVFYRPEKTCKMRNIRDHFCGACRHVLRETIRRAATGNAMPRPPAGKPECFDPGPGIAIGGH